MKISYVPKIHENHTTFSSNLPLGTVFSFPCTIWLLTHRRFFRDNDNIQIFFTQNRAVLPEFEIGMQKLNLKEPLLINWSYLIEKVKLKENWYAKIFLKFTLR